MSARSTTGQTGGTTDSARAIASRVQAIRKTLTRGAAGPDGPVVEVRIEIPRGSRNKYEYDEERQALRLDRTLHSSVHYPTDYGYILGTLAPDGDPVDVLVVVEEPTVPGCLVAARVIGLLDMRDEKGRDEKVLAVPVGDPRFQGIEELRDLPGHWLREIEAFFATYKLLKEKEVEVLGWHDRSAALALIAECRAAYLERQAAEGQRGAPPGARRGGRRAGAPPGTAPSPRGHPASRGNPG